MPSRAAAEVRRLVRDALREDLGARGDVTSRALIPAGARGVGWIVANQPAVVAGLAVAGLAFQLVSRRTRVRLLVRDGRLVPAGTKVARVEGPLRALLAAERTALNLLQRLSGIATLTRRYALLARPYGVAILDTRKTTPLLRRLEKRAVRLGGGRNHRMGLHDAVLIKDNHLAVVGSARAAVLRARRRTRLPVEVECQSLRQVRDALAARPDAILLDNLPLPALRRAIRLIRRHPRVRIEISGGVTLDIVRRLAALRPDWISVGALTHSAPAADFALAIEPAFSRPAAGPPPRTATARRRRA
jgi:nicotinate-nucleotide pyrophosphorylase (carboxylating)